MLLVLKPPPPLEKKANPNQWVYLFVCLLGGLFRLFAQPPATQKLWEWDSEWDWDWDRAHSRRHYADPWMDSHYKNQ